MKNHSLFPWRPLCAWGMAGMLVVGASLGAGRLAAQDAYEQALKKEEQARAKDPAWKPKYKETSVIRVTGKGPGAVNNFCLDRQGNLLVCYGLEDEDGKKKVATELQVISPQGKVLQRFPLSFNPQAVCVGNDGCIFVGGGGKLCKLSPEGKVLAEAPTPSIQADAAERQQREEQLKKQREEMKQRLQEDNQRISEAQMKKLLDSIMESLKKRRGNVSGLTLMGEDLYVSAPSPAEFGFEVRRVDTKLRNPVRVLSKLSGCCSQMEIQARASQLWVAHNGKHKVECYDPEGKLLASFGQRDSVAASGFGGCCEPKNLCFAPNGDVLAAESGPPVCVKRFTPDGKFLGVLALPKYKTGCVRVTVAMPADERTIYLLNPSDNAIHVFTL